MDGVTVSQVAKAFGIGKKQKGVSTYFAKVVSTTGGLVVQMGGAQVPVMQFCTASVGDVVLVLVTEAGQPVAIATKE